MLLPYTGWAMNKEKYKSLMYDRKVNSQFKLMYTLPQKAFEDSDIFYADNLFSVSCPLPSLGTPALHTYF